MLSNPKVHILIDVNVIDTRNTWKVLLAHKAAPIQVENPMVPLRSFSIDMMHYNVVLVVKAGLTGT